MVEFILGISITLNVLFIIGLIAAWKFQNKMAKAQSKLVRKSLMKFYKNLHQGQA
jgi:hypothetical protein